MARSALLDSYAGPFDPARRPRLVLAPGARDAGTRVALERPPAGPRRAAQGGDPARHRAAGGDLDRGVDGGEPGLLEAHAARARLRGQRRVDRVQEPPARHRRAAPVHGLPVPARPARVRRVLALALRRAHGRGEVRRGARAPHVPRHRGPHLRRHGRRDAPVHEDAPDPPAAARPGRPLSALPLGRVHRRREQAVRAAPEPRDRARLEDRADADRRSRARRRAGRLGRLLGPVRPGLPARGPLAPRARDREPGVRGAEPSARARLPALLSRSASATTRASELAESQWTGIAALTAGRLRAPLGDRGRRHRCRGEDLPDPPVLLPAHLRRLLASRSRARRARASRSATAPRSRRATPTAGSRGCARRRTARSTRSRAP